MKRVISLVLVLVLAFSTVLPSFAEKTTKAAVEEVSIYTKELASYGIIEGDGVSFTEDGELTRAAMAKILAFFYGENEVAKDFAVDFGFTDMDANAWYVPWVNYGASRGYMIGGGVGYSFRPNEAISAQEVNQLMIRVLGFSNDDVAWGDVNAKAKELKVEVSATDTDKVLRGEAFKAIRMVLDATPVDGTMTLGSKLKLPNYVAPFIPVTYLVAEMASATNLKEVTVKFNKAVDEAKAGLITSYTVAGKTITAVALSTDKMSATLTLDTAFVQQSKITVKVLKAAGLALDTTLEIASVIDTSIPVIESIVLSGPKTLEVTFSEPVKAGISPVVVINNGLYGTTTKTLSADGRTLLVTIAASLTADTNYQVKVSGYFDFANFSALTKEATVTFVKDFTLPTATLTSASQTEVVITFDKAVTKEDNSSLDTNYFYQTYTAWKPVSVTNVANKVFTLSFNDGAGGLADYYLPQGNTNVHILANDGTSKVIDAWGNEFAGTTLVASVTADSAAPIVTKVEATKENQIQITFDEEVTSAIGNYIIKDNTSKVADTGVITFSYASKVATLDFPVTKKLSGGTYTIEIKGVKDTSLGTNAMATVVLPFTVSDKTPATVSATVVEAANETTDVTMAQYIYITYSENMNTTTTLNTEYYQLNGLALPVGTTLEAFGGSLNKVKLSLPDVAYTLVGTTTTSRLTVGQVTDLAGNKISALSTKIAITGDGSPSLINVKSLGLNKVQLTFNGLLDVGTITAGGLKIQTDGVAMTLASIGTVTKTTTQTIVVVYLQHDEKLATPASKVTGATFVNEMWKSETAKPAVVGAVTYTDGIAPSYLSAVQTTANKFVLTFDESLDTLSAPLDDIDFVITLANGTVLRAGTEYQVNVTTGTTIEITLTTPVVETISYATVAKPVYTIDDAGNTINAIVTKTISLVAAP